MKIVCTSTFKGVAEGLGPDVYEIAANIKWSLEYTEKMLEQEKLDAEEQKRSAHSR